MIRLLESFLSVSTNKLNILITDIKKSDCLMSIGNVLFIGIVDPSRMIGFVISFKKIELAETVLETSPGVYGVFDP